MIVWAETAPAALKRAFFAFAQKMANRLIVGHFRYGSARAEQKYCSRLGEELKAYKRSGNAEHLYNIANYAVLESIAPEHPKFHFDALVGSATRKKFGGARAE